MISFIKGKIIQNSLGKLTVFTAGGVGYDIIVNIDTAEKLQGQTEVEIHTYLSVKENGMDLFGFLTEAERGLFLKLLSVNGVGPKSALNILSLGKPEEIVRAIVNKNSDYLAEAHGIGKKAAERIVVDLNNKLGEASMIGEYAMSGDKDILSDVVEGLVTLGYSRAQALTAIKDIPSEGRNSEDVLREALKRVK